MRIASGHCAFCLQPIPDGSRVETGRILMLADLERARGKSRRARTRRSTRWLGVLLVGVSVGGALLGLLLVGMKWLTAFFDRGTSWRG